MVVPVGEIPMEATLRMPSRGLSDWRAVLLAMSISAGPWMKTLRAKLWLVWIYDCIMSHVKVVIPSIGIEKLRRTRCDDSCTVGAFVAMDPATASV